MIISQSAKIYADALAGTAKNGAVTYDILLSDLETVLNIIRSSSELKTVLNTPAVPVEQKLQIIQDVFTNEVIPEIVNFLKLLAEKGRFNELDEIVAAYKIKLDEINNIKRATVISAVSLDDEYKNKIINALNISFQKNVQCEWDVNSDIIGGLVIRIDDNIIDTSVKSKLNNLNKIKGNL